MDNSNSGNSNNRDCSSSFTMNMSSSMSMIMNMSSNRLSTESLENIEEALLSSSMLRSPDPEVLQRGHTLRRSIVLNMDREQREQREEAQRTNAQVIEMTRGMDQVNDDMLMPNEFDIVLQDGVRQPPLLRLRPHSNRAMALHACVACGAAVLSDTPRRRLTIPPPTSWFIADTPLPHRCGCRNLEDVSRFDRRTTDTAEPSWDPFFPMSPATSDRFVLHLPTEETSFQQHSIGLGWDDDDDDDDHDEELMRTTESAFRRIILRPKMMTRCHSDPLHQEPTTLDSNLPPAPPLYASSTSSSSTTSPTLPIPIGVPPRHQEIVPTVSMQDWVQRDHLPLLPLMLTPELVRPISRAMTLPPISLPPPPSLRATLLMPREVTSIPQPRSQDGTCLDTPKTPLDFHVARSPSQEC